MTDRPLDPAPASDAEARHHALVGLHALSGAIGPLEPGVLPGFRAASPGTALRSVAEAPEHEIPLSARVHLLHNLAAAGFPEYEHHEAEYRRLAASVAEPRGLDGEQLLSDLKESAGGVPFRTTASGQALPHRDVAFIGQDVCQTRTVQVGGLAATWVFSEFETDAPFDDVVGWIDPRSWPQRGPMLFKRMDLVGTGAPVQISGLGDEHWHGVFHEEVQLVRRVNTLLHCDFWRDGAQAAGMTYDLDLSLDGEIDVDRGFLSVVELGTVRRVKALKIVGFTADVWDRVAAMVCPFWTDWVRGAVESGSTSTPSAPTHEPGSTGDGRQPTSDVMQAWLDFFGDSARTYLDLLTDMSGRATSGGYSASDWLADGTRYWSQLAKDWARAWTYGLETLDEVAREGLDAGLVPPGAPRAAARGAATAMAGAATAAAPARGEGTTVLVADLSPGEQPTCSDLVSIEAGGATIPSAKISVTVQPWGGRMSGVRVETTDPAVPAGLYVGRLQSTTGTIPVQLYLSRATETTGP